jgi:hypothetical protein
MTEPSEVGTAEAAEAAVVMRRMVSPTSNDDDWLCTADRTRATACRTDPVNV